MTYHIPIYPFPTSLLSGSVQQLLLLLAQHNLTASKQQTHWPHANIFTERKYVQERLGAPETYIRERPAAEPEETDAVLRLAGVLPHE